MRRARPVVAALLCCVAVVQAQGTLTRLERQRVQQMLKSIKDEIRKNYYDPAFRGVDLEQHFGAAHARLEQATSLGHAMGIVAQTLLDLDDSHTFFVPPRRTTRVEYEWKTQIVGDDCFVVAVRPGSDAAQKGLTPGTRLLAIDGRKPTRATLWKIEYLVYYLNPRPGLRLSVQQPGGSPRDVDLMAKVTQGARTIDLTANQSLEFDSYEREADRHYLQSRHRFVRFGTAVFWKMPGFNRMPDEFDRVTDEALAGAESLVLDMRGNPGGYVKTLERLAGRLFDREIKIAELKGRKTMKPMLAARHRRPFGGTVVALVDSRSASAAELLARLLQLEKRGTVVGDRSSGSVMQSYYYDGRMGADRLIFFGASVTNADVIMADGKSLEHTGVTPDEVILPTAEDLAAGRDPALSRAAALVGVTIDAAAAGKLFPTEWD